MKEFKNIAKIVFSAIFILSIASGCKKGAELSIEPTPVVVPFTFTPSHASPGSQVVIEGSNLTNVSKVSFGVTEGDIVSQTESQVTVLIPVAAITAPIKLISNGVVITSSTDFVVDKTPIPTIISFSPAIAGSGETVTIAGNILDKVDSVFIGNLKAAILPGRTASELKITTPVGLQTASIRMFYNYETSYGMVKVAESVSGTKLSLKLPTIESITPDITTLNIGNQLIFIGTMFDVVTSVKFGTISATYTIVSPTEMTLTVPAGATTGKITMTVPDGTTEYKDSYVVTLPAITSFFPFKGAEIVGGTRDIIVSGTKLDLVTSVKVGTTTATIMSQTADNIAVRISGSTSGAIALNTVNGTVNSTVPFIITGSFWLTNYDQTFIPQRMTSEAWDGGVGGSYTFSIVASGEARGNYRKTTATVLAGGSPRFYFRGDQTGANPAPDRYLLYTNSSKDVYLEFDISYNSLPASLIDANGEVSLKVFLFAADQARGYGYSSMHKVKFDGPNIWKTVRVNTNNMGKEASGGLFTATIPALSNRFEPNNCRIIGVIFAGAIGDAASVGQIIDVNFDNVKFIIE